MVYSSSNASPTKLLSATLVYVVLAGLLYLICEIYVDVLIVYGVDEDDFIPNLRIIFINV